MSGAPFLTDLPRFVFFTGKGGVGKTSLACATAVRLAEEGKRGLLTSTDPASNVGQVFEVSVGNTITPVPGVPGLSALEIDPQQAADAYRAQIIDAVRELLPAVEIAATPTRRLIQAGDHCSPSRPRHLRPARMPLTPSRAVPTFRTSAFSTRSPE